MGNLQQSKSQGANTKVDGHPQIALRPESLLATLATWLRLGLPGKGAGDYNKHQEYGFATFKKKDIWWKTLHIYIIIHI